MAVVRSAFLAIALLAFLLLALAANVGVWALATLADSDTFAETTTGIISQPAVRSLISDRLAERLTDLVVPPGGRVPAQARDALGLPRTAGRDDVQEALARLVGQLLLEPRMVAVQQSALDALHSAVMDAVGTDRRGDPHDPITLDLDDVIAALAQQVDPGAAGFMGRVVPGDLGTLVVVDVDQLAVLGRALRLLEVVRWVLPLSCLAAAMLVLLLARARLHVLAWLGLCLVVVGATCLLAASGAPVVASRLVQHSADSLPSLEATLDGLTGSLITQSAVLAGVGLAMLVVGISAGVVTGRSDGRSRFEGYA